LVYFPMMFVAGVWTPGPVMPDAVRKVADFTPLGAASQAMSAAWAGDPVRWVHLVVMAGFTAGLGAIAVRSFRWS
jgi:ABC-2 type transport system permease protein